VRGDDLLDLFLPACMPVFLLPYSCLYPDLMPAGGVNSSAGLNESNCRYMDALLSFALSHTFLETKPGLAIAQFQALSTQHGAQALVDEYTEKARTRRSRMPEEAKRKMEKNSIKRHTEELGKMKNFKDETDKEQWVRKLWRTDKVSKLLQPKTEEPKGTKK
jgi:hypothetical protein